MTKEQAAAIVAAQRTFFLSGATRDVGFRVSHLERLGAAFKRHEADMYRAVREDMGRAEMETFFMEVFSNQEELEFALKHIDKWTRPRSVKTPTLFFMSDSVIHPEPFGVSLIISAWNFPLLQLFSPLIGAIAAGNTAILKPAGDARACSRSSQEIDVRLRLASWCDRRHSSHWFMVLEMFLWTTLPRGRAYRRRG